MRVVKALTLTVLNSCRHYLGVARIDGTLAVRFRGGVDVD